MKFRFSIRMILIVIAFVAVLLMNVHERRQHAAALDEAARTSRDAFNRLYALGMEDVVAPFGRNEFRVVVVDLYGDSRQYLQNCDVIAQRVFIITHGFSRVTLSGPPHDSATRPLSGMTHRPNGLNVHGGTDASCMLSVYACVPPAQDHNHEATLHFNLFLRSEQSSTGGSFTSCFSDGGSLPDHFRFDLKAGVYPLGEPIDFYAIGGNRKGDLRKVQLVVGKAPKPSPTEPP